jgi:hypothetical protein
MRLRNALLVLVAAGALGVAGCISAGAPVTEEFDATGVEEVVLAAPGDMVIVQGDAETLTMDTGENVAERITVVVDDGVMEIELDESAITIPTFELDFVLEVPNVTGVDIAGSGSVEGEGFEADEFRALVSGSGAISVDDLTCDDLVVDIGGSGAVGLTGVADDQIVTISGSGSYDGADLEADAADVTVSGSGSTTVWVVKRLDATVSGSGSISYYGEPQVDETVSGSGVISGQGSK